MVALQSERPRLFSIAVASRMAGASPSTLRRLEASGVIAPIRVEGEDKRRAYTPEDVAAIRAARAKQHDEGPE